MSQLRKGVSYPSNDCSFNKGVWATLRRFAAQTLKLRELATTLCGYQSVEGIHKLVSRISQDSLIAVGNMIDKNIDFTESEIRRPF
ncbi:hypothetical protein CDD83_1853 [Cordyceps sp. RAO-2017]|nr:hypothetical protein CDD83_1853 [Cordyceps sp. RAO-2017]